MTNDTDTYFKVLRFVRSSYNAGDVVFRLILTAWDRFSQCNHVPCFLDGCPLSEVGLVDSDCILKWLQQTGNGIPEQYAVSPLWFLETCDWGYIAKLIPTVFHSIGSKQEVIFCDGSRCGGRVDCNVSLQRLILAVGHTRDGRPFSICCRPDGRNLESTIGPNECTCNSSKPLWNTTRFHEPPRWQTVENDWTDLTQLDRVTSETAWASQFRPCSPVLAADWMWCSRAVPEVTCVLCPIYWFI